MALKLGDYVVTEAGFGADLGAEKFLNIKMRMLNKHPNVIVLVATLRALRYHGFEDEGKSNIEALRKGLSNITRHANNIKRFGIPYIIAINHFFNDDKEEVELLINWAKENKHPVSFVDSFLEGSKGAIDLANKVVELAEKKTNFKYTYELKDDLYNKVDRLQDKSMVQMVLSIQKNKEKLDLLNKNIHLPVCIAKTPLSFQIWLKGPFMSLIYLLVMQESQRSEVCGCVN